MDEVYGIESVKVMYPAQINWFNCSHDTRKLNKFDELIEFDYISNQTRNNICPIKQLN